MLSTVTPAKRTSAAMIASPTHDRLRITAHASTGIQNASDAAMSMVVLTAHPISA